ncbi:hypothetical protein ACHAWU_004147 [Discostella pseudostelligera]|uniref:Uncharacterized protein n=1 Tax=Discostella pseudostelligera TaxID=259834 RepID=A0ABD3MV80_9STRA
MLASSIAAALVVVGQLLKCHSAFVVPSALNTIGRSTDIFFTKQPQHIKLISQSSPLSITTSSISTRTTKSKTTSTTLHNGIILDVDDNFFTYTFFSIGLFYSLGKAYNRYLLEEIAFEQRKLEARERILESDPTMDELTLRRMESAKWLSVYGRKYRGRGETAATSDRGGGGEDDERGDGVGRRRRRSRVATMDDEDDDYYDDDDDDDAPTTMSSDEITAFESQYNIPYDPYYDEPYTESQLPSGKYKVDKSYGDRRYENGEIFYKEEGTGLYYRMGSRPRQKKFWDWGGGKK